MNEQQEVLTKDDHNVKPYRLFGHPKMSLVNNILLYIVFHLKFRATQFQTCLTTMKSLKTRKLLSRFRNNANILGFLLQRMEIQLWKMQSVQNIHEYKCRLPRNCNIFAEWGITETFTTQNNDVDKKLVISNNLKKADDDIAISVISSTGTIQYYSENILDGTSKFLNLSTFTKQLNELSESVNIILFYWSGGYSVKFDDGKGIKLARLLMKEQIQLLKRGNVSPDILLITPDYRLAPEYPFPAAIIDGLSVVNFLLENIPKHTPINLCGVSAGGHLAAVSLLETHRKFPGRIRR